jgi:hypothetical protein
MSQQSWKNFRDSEERKEKSMVPHPFRALFEMGGEWRPLSSPGRIPEVAGSEYRTDGTYPGFYVDRFIRPRFRKIGERPVWSHISVPYSEGLV